MDLINNVRVANLTKDVQYIDFYNSSDQSFTAAYGLRYKGIVFDVSFVMRKPYAYNEPVKTYQLYVTITCYNNSNLKFGELIQQGNITFIDLDENEPIKPDSQWSMANNYCQNTFTLTKTDYRIRMQFK